MSETKGQEEEKKQLCTAARTMDGNLVQMEKCRRWKKKTKQRDNNTAEQGVHTPFLTRVEAENRCFRSHGFALFTKEGQKREIWTAGSVQVQQKELHSSKIRRCKVRKERQQSTEYRVPPITAPALAGRKIHNLIPPLSLGALPNTNKGCFLVWFLRCHSTHGVQDASGVQRR